jgi:hypothetical protein
LATEEVVTLEKEYEGKILASKMFESEINVLELQLQQMA